MTPKLKKPTKMAPSTQKAAMKDTGARRVSARSTPGRMRKNDRSKLKGKRPRYKLKLKGWLATPADWARFNAWVKTNALPKKYPEPPPIVRPTKALSLLRKRIKNLATPKKTVDPMTLCRLDFEIPRTALTLIASKRTLLLAIPNIRLPDYGRVYYKVSPGALLYEASSRILSLSQPKPLCLPDECKQPKPSNLCKAGVDEERLAKLALAKKLLACPDQLTPEEIAILFTAYGIKRSALEYDITPWMTFLSIPPYKKLKERKDEKAIAWKKTIVEEGEQRGKEALAAQRKKEEEAEAKRGKKRKYEDVDEEQSEADKKKKEARAKKRKIEKNAWRYAPPPTRAFPFTVRKGALKGEASPRTTELAAHRDRKDRVTRKNPFTVRKGALSASASGRTESLAKPKMPRDPVEKTPPREKDKYGRPIFEIRVYEKRLPRTKPYKMGECPPTEKKKPHKRRPIDPIIYEQTYDPCIYPDMAKRQKMERKRAEKLFPKKGKGKRKQKRRDRKREKPDEAGEMAAAEGAEAEEVAEEE